MHALVDLQTISAKIKQAPNSPPPIASIIGCVIDATRPIYRQKENNYIVEIKLVDQSLNQSTQNSLIKYLHLYLFSDKKEDLEFCQRIGQFVYLQKFVFYKWNDLKLTTKFHGRFESLFLIEGDYMLDEEFKLVRKLGKQNAMFYIHFLSQKIINLKNWLNIHFAQIFSPFLGVKIINNTCTLIEPFLIILQVDSEVQNQFQKNLYLLDSNQNSFYINMKDFKTNSFQKGQWLLLRGVRKIDNHYQIIFTESGNILKLPKQFAQSYQKLSNYQAFYKKPNKISLQKKEDAKLTYTTMSDQKVSTVKQLFQLQDKYLGTSKKQEVVKQSYFFVKGVLVKYTGKIKLYHTEYQMIVHENFLDGISIQQKKQTIEQRKLTYIYQGTLYVMDRSVMSKKQLLKIKLFTNQPKATFFDTKYLQSLNQYIGNSDQDQKINQSLVKINQKLQKLLQLSNFDNPASFVLEPIISDQLLFRLINTNIL